MTRRSPFLFWAIQLVHLAVESNCYVVDPRNSRGYERGNLIRHLSASKNNIENGIKTKRKSKNSALTRCPDYPSLAMNDDLTRKVSLDNKKERRRKEDDNESSWVNRKLYELLATASPLELDILVTGVRDSNRRTRLLNKRPTTDILVV